MIRPMARTITTVVALSVLALSGTAATAARGEPGCRAIGMEARQGETLCIPTPAGQRMASCGMVLNVSSWTFLTEPCRPNGAEDTAPVQQPEEQDSNG